MKRKRPILYAANPDILLEMGENIADQNARSLFFLLYLTGSRISEAIDFTMSKVNLHENYTSIRMKILKRKNDGKDIRKVVIPLGPAAKCNENKMWEYLFDYISNFEYLEYPFKKWHNMSEYLARQVGNISLDAHIFSHSNNTWYDDVIQKRFNPHYLRHCRATHLVQYYDFADAELRNFFGWKNANMAVNYTNMRTLRDAFGV